MRSLLLKCKIIFTLSMLATASCLSLSVWKNERSAALRVQTPFNIGFELKSPIQIPFVSRFINRPSDTNYIDTNVNNPYKYRSTDKITTYQETADDRSNIVTKYIENTPAYYDLKKIKNDLKTIGEPNNILEHDNTSTYTTMTETETTTEFTSETYSTEDYESTTSDDDILNRSGVNPHVVASLLG